MYRFVIDNIMEALLSLYNTAPSKYELEFRVRGMDLDVLRMLLKSITPKTRIERTREIVCYPRSAPPHTRCIKAKPAGSSKYSSWEVQRKIERKRVFTRNGKLVLSEELPVSPSAGRPNIQEHDRCRFKSRVRVLSGDWFHDFTLVRDSKASSSTMKSDVMEFESYGDLMDDLTRLPPRTSVEYEIEHAVAAPVSVAQAMYILTSLSSSTPTFNQMALLLAKHVHGPGNSLKRLLPSVSPLNVLTYRQLYPLSNYYVTYKLDGERAAMMISGKSAAVMSDPSTVIEVVAFSTAEEKNAAAAPTVWLDGEWYQGSFYAFDVILPHAMRFSDRLRHLTSTIAALEASGVREKIYAKPYVFLGPTV